MKNSEFQRAKNIVLQDKFDFESQRFCKQLADFLSDYFTYDSLTVNALEGASNNLVLTVDICNVKKSRTV